MSRKVTLTGAVRVLADNFEALGLLSFAPSGGGIVAYRPHIGCDPTRSSHVNAFLDPTAEVAGYERREVDTYADAIAWLQDPTPPFPLAPRCWCWLPERRFLVRWVVRLDDDRGVGLHFFAPNFTLRGTDHRGESPLQANKLITVGPDHSGRTGELAFIRSNAKSFSTFRHGRVIDRAKRLDQIIARMLHLAAGEQPSRHLALRVEALAREIGPYLTRHGIDLESYDVDRLATMLATSHEGPLGG